MYLWGNPLPKRRKKRKREVPGGPGAAEGGTERIANPGGDRPRAASWLASEGARPKKRPGIKKPYND